MSLVHPHSIVDPSAVIADDVTVGPWSHIGPGCTIGSGTTIGPHVCIHKNTKIGCHNTVHAFASIGGNPQVSDYKQEDVSTLTVGDRNVFHEYVTINRGCCIRGSGKTVIGSDNLFQVSSHVAHDCLIGNHVIFGNSSAVAGHVKISDFVILGAWVGVHQFCEVGNGSFLTHSAMVTQDILPFLIVAGNKARVRGINVEGLKRRAVSQADLSVIKRVYKSAYIQKMPQNELISLVKDLLDEGHELLRPMLDMLQLTKRGFLR